MGRVCGTIAPHNNAKPGPRAAEKRAASSNALDSICCWGLSSALAACAERTDTVVPMATLRAGPAAPALRSAGGGASGGAARPACAALQCCRRPPLALRHNAAPGDAQAGRLSWRIAAGALVLLSAL